ncbi:hypothetical protein [Wolbachia endosymbiont of Chironomus riparius]|jgi:hypothetical protein|nr:hypothetical protein [Wolbachia endosymbiont of Chironomus riparius]
MEDTFPNLALPGRKEVLKRDMRLMQANEQPSIGIFTLKKRKSTH